MNTIEFYRNGNKIAQLDIDKESATHGQIISGIVFKSINQAKRFSRLNCAGKLINRHFKFPDDVTPANA
jgi:hypothetical protein